MQLFTIGFTKKSAQDFFQRLETARVRNLIDVRISNTSQLAGFAKKDDLAWFADRVAGIGYRHQQEFLPDADMMRAYRRKELSWDAYADGFRNLIAKRKIEKLDQAAFDGGCLLCSEDKPHHCHRRIVAEYLEARWPDVEVVHL